MATRQGDELSGDPGPAGTSPAAVGPPADRAPAAEGVMPSAAEWEQTWLPGWLTGPEADTEDGIGGAGIPQEPFVLPAGGADPVAAVPDRFSGEGAPPRVVARVVPSPRRPPS